MTSSVTPFFLQGFLWLCCVTDWSRVIGTSPTIPSPLYASNASSLDSVNSTSLKIEKGNSLSQSMSPFSEHKPGLDSLPLHLEPAVLRLVEPPNSFPNSTRRALAIRPVRKTLVHEVEYSTHIVPALLPAASSPTSKPHNSSELPLDAEPLVSSTPAEVSDRTDGSLSDARIPNTTPVTMDTTNFHDLISNRSETEGSLLQKESTFPWNTTKLDPTLLLLKTGTTYGRSIEATRLNVAVNNSKESVIPVNTTPKSSSEDNQEFVQKGDVGVKENLSNNTSELGAQNVEEEEHSGVGPYSADSLVEHSTNFTVMRKDVHDESMESEAFYNVTWDFTTLPATVAGNSSQVTIIYAFPNTTLEVVEFLQNAAIGAGSIVGIVLAGLCLSTVVFGAVVFWYYKYRHLHRPQTLQERYAPSELGYGPSDGSFRVGYIHHPDIPKDSSEEMYSLDNDSFLNSLEAMTIPNYWTEQIKHTKL